jgi:hypothetical protein
MQEEIRLYQICAIKKSVHVGAKKHPAIKVKCLSVDGVGMFVYYDKESQLDPELIKTFQPITEITVFFIEAKDFRNAIVKFFTENQATEIGGDKIYSRALYIDPSKIIVEFPFCPLMHKNLYGEFICGAPYIRGGEQGEIGMCIVENYMPPKDCTFISFQNRLLADYKKYKKIAERKRVLGFKVLKSNQIKPAKFPPVFSEESW